MIGIYCLTNKVNGKKYFGQSIDLERRKKHYFNYGRFPNDHLKNAFNKYGKENFEFQIIKCYKEKYLDRFEKLYIRINNTTNREKGYNKESGGNLNKHPSDETRKKLSKAKSGENHPFYKQKHTPETRKKMSENHVGMLGKKHTPESREKMSKAKSGENHPFYDQKHTPESLKKMSETKSGENNPNWKDYPRITKAGKKNGKQKYKIRYNGKNFYESVYKERLYERWYDKYPNIELIDETVVD